MSATSTTPRFTPSREVLEFRAAKARKHVTLAELARRAKVELTRAKMIHGGRYNDTTGLNKLIRALNTFPTP
jgi:hypothetical protein